MKKYISESIESMKKVKLTQKSNKEKVALNNLIRAKNTKIVINDINKNTYCRRRN